MYASGGGVGSCVASRSDEQRAERARADGLGGGAIAGVETPLEPDLHEDPGPFDLVRPRRRASRGRARPASRRRPAARPARRAAGASACGRRRRGDHERVDAGGDERLGRRDGPGAEGRRRASRRGLVGVAQRQRANAGDARQRPRVERADPSDTDQSDVERVAQRLRRGGSSRVSGYSKRLQIPPSRRAQAIDRGGPVDSRSTRVGGNRWCTLRRASPADQVRGAARSRAGRSRTRAGGSSSAAATCRARGAGRRTRRSTGRRAPLRPLERIAFSAPIAERSFAQNTAVKLGARLEQRAHRGVPAGLGEVPDRDERRVGLEARVGERVAIAGEALLADPRRRTLDVRDPGVPERQEVLGREPRAKPVVDLDERDHRASRHRGRGRRSGTRPRRTRRSARAEARARRRARRPRAWRAAGGGSEPPARDRPRSCRAASSGRACSTSCWIPLTSSA